VFRRGGERREQIIDAALDVLEEGGVKGLTLRRVAGNVGVSEPALYRHFRSKKELLEALLDRAEQQFGGCFAFLNEAPSDSRQAIRRFLAAVFEQFHRRPGYAPLLLSEELLHHAEGLAGRMAETIERQIWRLSGYIAEGVQRGSFRPDIEPRAAAQMFLGTVRLEVTRRHLAGGEWNPEERAADTAELFVRVLASFPADDFPGAGQ
jgi:AcrR family transcriptional regulator